MPARVLLSVDTELTWRHHRPGGGWQGNFARSYEAAGVGVPYQLEVLARHGLKACFFVDPMPALLFGLEPVRRMVEPIVAAGQEVQLHLHPFWASLAEGRDDRRELAAYAPDEQRRLVATARKLLIEAGAPAPIAFRAGSYAVNADTLTALAESGIRYDSSHNGCHHPDPSGLELPPEQVAPIEVGGVIELPVGQIEEARGGLRHLQICAVSSVEMRLALAHADRGQHPVTTIVSHSFELATRDGLRANGVVHRRFLRLCRFLSARRESHPTCWFSDLDGLPLGMPARPARLGHGPRLHRIVQQAWGNSRYEALPAYVR